MKITFRDAAISDGPLRVLKHLYYYTVQYGLSVRQFTGQDQHYWAHLPARLRAAASPQKRNAVLVELEALAARAEERRARRREQLKTWEGKEIVLTAQLCAVLCALPDTLLVSLFGRLTSPSEMPPTLRMAELKMSGDEDQHVDFLEPDALLHRSRCPPRNRARPPRRSAT